MEDFAFHRPDTLAAAQEAIQGAEDGKFMAGGQSLLPLMKLDMAAPDTVVSLAGLEELRGITREGDTLTVGAAATHYMMSNDDVLNARARAMQ